MTEIMVRDIHPAEVVLSDGRVLTGARVFITTERFIVWTQDARRNITKTVELPLTTTTADRSRATMQDGQRFEVSGESYTAIVNKGNGCGCHSPLKGLGSPVGWSA